MPYFPFFNSQYHRNNSYMNNYFKNYNKLKIPYSSSNQECIENTNVNTENEHKNKGTKRPLSNFSSINNSFMNFNFSNMFSSNFDEPVLRIMGIDLFSDDLLIVCLLFFLYTENVKDEWLFICLIMLLLG